MPRGSSPLAFLLSLNALPQSESDSSPLAHGIERLGAKLAARSCGSYLVAAVVDVLLHYLDHQPFASRRQEVAVACLFLALIRPILIVTLLTLVL